MFFSKFRSYWKQNILSDYFKYKSCACCDSIRHLAIAGAIDADVRLYEFLDLDNPIMSKHQRKRAIKSYVKHERKLIDILHARHKLNVGANSYHFLPISFDFD